MFCYFFVLLVIDISIFFFFNDTATTEIYTLSLHDALPISHPSARERDRPDAAAEHDDEGVAPDGGDRDDGDPGGYLDRKSTRLNSSHLVISYAVFCLKKKKKTRREYDAWMGERSPCSTMDC